MSATAMNQEKIRLKIQKALALASNNPSQEEAQAALLQAQRLMLKYGIDETEITMKNKKERNVIEMEATLVKKLFWYEKDLAQIIADNFRCYKFWRGHGNKNKIMFMGFEDDVKIAVEVYKYAIVCMNHLCEQFIKDHYSGYCSSAKRDARKNYRLGFLDGLEKRFQEQVQEYGLMIIKDEKVVDSYENKEIKIVKNSTPTINYEDLKSYKQGLKDSETFDYQRKQVEG